jgi:hypothetical protein
LAHREAAPKQLEKHGGEEGNPPDFYTLYKDTQFVDSIVIGEKTLFWNLSALIVFWCTSPGMETS